MKKLELFRNDELGEFRGLEIEGEPWFVGRDICLIFGDTNHSRSLSRIDESDKRKINITDSLGRSQEIIIINESGLYSLLFAMQPQKANKDGVSDAYPTETRNRIEKLHKFKHWVTSEVLPSIRKNGGYVNNDDLFIQTYLPFADDQTRALFRTTLSTIREQNEQLKCKDKQLLEQKPKVEFFDAVTDSKDAIPMADVAKVLDMGIGRNKLFEFLRNKNILMADNRPYQKYIDAGYFRVVEQRYDKGFGEVGINIKTLVFQKGVDFIRKKLAEEVKIL